MPAVSDEFVAGLISAATGQKVLTHENLMRKKTENAILHSEPINLDSSHQILLMRGPVSNLESSKQIDVTVKTLSGMTTSITCSPTETIGGFKSLLYAAQGIRPDQQTLRLAGEQLRGSSTLHSYNIGDKDVVQLGTKTKDGEECLYYLDSKFRSPGYDYDFTNITDKGVDFKRGGYVYKRPIGTNRIALNVLKRYEDDIWLEMGDKGWPVSYHGTGRNNLQSIAEYGYLLSKGTSFYHGRGIYSTPSLELAMAYAKDYTYQNHKYKFIFQNRVNPNTVKHFDNIWLSENERDVRPYGICFKKI